ncbi:aromatic amino acid hydroxylase [Thermoflavimicrobium daqui]|uniref:Aromatic amino acid hydroxylase n=1 Tax=Thermoflavimicrobium daqui TaxID=2137476 RepID=A0A364K450_9BACL|nr:aromatic amino acid hydroxylase [Thermoflavimicrobium daqui]RAL24154.1 aromatic amino acid hydroxylase [Thermoflavimicrobium daqui]
MLNQVQIPAHLKRYISKQRYEQYTPINQAVWRYVMRQNFHFFKERAHIAYRDGLTQSGISIERIPRIEEMDQCLQPFGWGAVPIDGLIPGVAFFDFQARGLLPIATDIRTLEHIAYTPAPDIIHEAAGHAPILCDHQYAEYVKIFGKIGAKALASKQENEVFQATRRLTLVMEDPHSTLDEIKQAEKELEEKVAKATEVSEATQISRLYWWTVEYGLIGDLDHPKIYGAGLLSSIGEGQHCLSDEVKKLPFDLEACITTDYDVTKPQPQLFVCHDFSELITAVEQFSERMAFRIGGNEGLEKAVQSGDVATAEYDTGVQISGVFTQLVKDQNGKAIYMRTAGPTALAYSYKELQGHGILRHTHGFGAPIGSIRGIDGLSSIQKGALIDLEYDSGIRLKGILKEWVNVNFQPVLLTLINCTVTYQDQVLFHPDWGEYDLIIGEKVVSVFAGAADPEKFFADENVELESEYVNTVTFSSLDHLYQKVRDIREKRQSSKDLPSIIRSLDDLYPNDWLLRLEILELCIEQEEFVSLAEKLKADLTKLKQKNSSLSFLIENGVKLIN